MMRFICYMFVRRNFSFLKTARSDWLLSFLVKLTLFYSCFGAGLAVAILVRILVQGCCFYVDDNDHYARGDFWNKHFSV